MAALPNKINVMSVSDEFLNGLIATDVKVGEIPVYVDPTLPSNTPPIFLTKEMIEDLSEEELKETKLFVSPELKEAMEKFDATLEMIDDLPIDKLPPPKEPTKIEEITNGFLMQGGKPVNEGDESFWLECHLIDQDTYFITANLSGIMTRADIKSLRKQFKNVMNMEKQTYNLDGLQEQNPAKVFHYEGVVPDAHGFPVLDQQAEDELLKGAKELGVDLNPTMPDNVFDDYFDDDTYNDLTDEVFDTPVNVGDKITWKDSGSSYVVSEVNEKGFKLLDSFEVPWSYSFSVLKDGTASVSNTANMEVGVSSPN